MLLNSPTSFSNLLFSYLNYFLRPFFIYIYSRIFHRHGIQHSLSLSSCALPLSSAVAGRKTVLQPNLNYDYAGRDVGGASSADDGWYEARRREERERQAMEERLEGIFGAIEGVDRTGRWTAAVVFAVGVRLAIG